MTEQQKMILAVVHKAPYCNLRQIADYLAEWFEIIPNESAIWLTLKKLEREGLVKSSLYHLSKNRKTRRYKSLLK
jgi:DNA-binding PadR family transcriptional regulator